jgi:hypothetical protein
VTWALFLLPVLVLLFVLPPLFRGERDERAERENRLDVLRERKRSLLAAIRELDLDREMGKVTEQDHEAERARLKEEALAAVRRLEAEEGGPRA